MITLNPFSVFGQRREITPIETQASPAIEEVVEEQLSPEAEYRKALEEFASPSGFRVPLPERNVEMEGARKLENIRELAAKAKIAEAELGADILKAQRVRDMKLYSTALQFLEIFRAGNSHYDRKPLADYAISLHKRISVLPDYSQVDTSRRDRYTSKYRRRKALLEETNKRKLHRA